MITAIRDRHKPAIALLLPQEIVAVDVVNTVQRTRSVCGPLAEIGVYKGWFIAVLAAIAVRRHTHPLLLRTEQ